ncbi:MAG: MT-A70 family methyltransferase, partial [Planctomycetota bacterium]
RPDDVTHRGRCPYPPMTIDAIKDLAVGDLAHEDCILWLWATNSHMAQAHEVAEAWGFAVKTILTWAKDRMGLGDWLRGQTEHCLMCVRGKPVVNLTNQTTLLHGAVREHSRKPAEFYQLVDGLCPGTKIELFARQEREGWESHGAERGLFSTEGAT